MIRKILIAALLAFGVSTTGFAADGVGHTVSLQLGTVFQSEDSDLRDDVGALSVATGYDFGAYRIELQGFGFNGGTNAGSVGDVDARILSVNGAFEPYTWRNFTPYVTGGVGYGLFEGSGVNGGDQKAGFVYNVGGGVSYNINASWAIDGTYRYFRTIEDVVSTNNGQNGEFAIHSVVVGTRYTF
jgi:opacity protein-like surface antigen